MAKLTVRPKLDVEIHFVVNEIEARALDALAGYDTDAFIKAFYEHLGQHYMRDHEAGLRTFLETIRGVVAGGLNQVDEARKALNQTRQLRNTEATLKLADEVAKIVKQADQETRKCVDASSAG